MPFRAADILLFYKSLRRKRDEREREKKSHLISKTYTLNMFATARSKAAAIASQPPFVSTKRRTSSASARAPIRVKASSGWIFRCSVLIAVWRLVILLVRLVTLGGGKAALSKQLEEQIARAKEKNIDISDLYYSEDQGEDAWYLVAIARPSQKRRFEVWRWTNETGNQESNTVGGSE